jgi:hypothetical protein
MKINFDVVMQDELEGGPIKRPDGKSDLTLAFAVRSGLLYGQYPQSTPEDHLKRQDLSDKIKVGGDVELSAEEVVLAKQALVAGWKISAVVGQGVKLLEGK